MIHRTALARLVLAAIFATGAGCGRADLYPITEQAHPNDSDNADAGEARDSGTQDGTVVTNPDGGAGASATETCAPTTASVGDSNETVLVDGVTRTYVLHVPSSYTGSSSAPLVVDFHGIGASGAKERSSSPYPAELDPQGVLMAFPDGLKGPAGTAWNVGPCCVANVDDVAFARALVAQVRTLACVDPARVYAVGILTGGGMAHYLACHAADVFAAVAPAAFDLLAENVDDCTPPRPISVISFRGTADSRVPYQGGASSLVPGMPLTFLGAQATFQKWAEIDGCTGTASTPDANGCSAYSGCAGGAEVILCTKQGGGEDPGDPNIAWPVLARHAL
jgi:polyhydroxybutyrate depolymerase